MYVCCSDGTLNPSGVRFGSAEIYNIGIYLVCVCLCVCVCVVAIHNLSAQWSIWMWELGTVCVWDSDTEVMRGSSSS